MVSVEVLVGIIILVIVFWYLFKIKGLIMLAGMLLFGASVKKKLSPLQKVFVIIGIDSLFLATILLWGY